MAGRFPILYLAEADAEDAVLSSGVLAYLVEAMPQARFTVVGSPTSAPLFADTPRLDRLLVLEKESKLEWLGLWNQVRAETWGCVVDMRGSALSTKLKRQKRAVRGEDEPGVHKVELAARVLQLEETPGPRLFVSEPTRAKVEALLPAGDGPLLAIGPGSAWMGRRWPAERFANLAVTLTSPGGPLAGAHVVVIGEESDRDAAHTIRLALPRHHTIELQGKLTPLQAVAVLQRCNLYVGNDSLWTHLATAAGTPVVAGYGPSDDVERGPWGGLVVRGPRSVEEFRKIDPRLNQAIEHMNELPTERMLRAVKKLLAERALA
ncbi:glycosyltransferase family 9 protein [Brevundimonas sp. Root1279]|uniref:glycosyltransferase family 9 protein n=1 Tax=Brevundimonas sp. Root1279 TaxID=1736443 RepID=UPI000700B558|nr:glycosyltransferase family 9 protein [Brevundimonas sp. Root1279]KQW80880.1 heptosyltransferase [Brevundimonas sp. Root1279]